MITFRRFSVFLLGMLALILSACSGGLGGEPRIVATTAPSSDLGSDADIAAVMTQGGDLWITHCAECHGQLGEGTSDGAPLPDLTAISDDQILAAVTNGVIRDGTRVMPSFADDMSPDQLSAAATFARMISTARTNGMIAPIATEDAASSAANVPDVVATVDPNATVEPQILGVVTGTVTNGTAGSTIPADLALTLHVVTSNVTEESFETVVGENGAYRFENVPFNAIYQYVITAPFGAIQFVSDIVTVDPATPEYDLPISIYETVFDPSVLTVTTLSAQIVAQDSTLQVIEIIGITNTSDRVYIDVATGQSVRVRVPDGATFSTPMSSRYGVTTDGAVTFDSRPVMPGEGHLVHVAYTLPYSGGATLTQSFDYRIEGQLEVLLASEGLTASGEGLTETGPVSTGSASMLGYAGAITRDIGAPISYTVSGNPTNTTTTTPTGGSTSTASPIAYVLIGAGISALLIAGVLALRERLTASGKTSKSTPEVNPKAAINALMEQIAELDVQQKAGKISARDYETKRAELKAQLSQLMNSQR